MKKEITLPDGWGEVTLEQWMTLGSIGESGTEGAVKRISVLSGLDHGEIMALESGSLEILASALHWTATPPKPRLERELVVAGKRLRLVTDASRLEVGCFIDIESLLSDGADENLHLILSALYRDPESPAYRGIDDDLATAILAMPCDIALGAARFFFLLAKAFTGITRTSLEIRARETMTS